MFEIESFDDDLAYDPDSLNNGEWSRPMSASGTNLASGMGLHDDASVDLANSPSPPPSEAARHSSPPIKRQHTSTPPKPQVDGSVLRNGVSNPGPPAIQSARRDSIADSPSPPPSMPDGYSSPMVDRKMSSPPPSPSRPKHSILGNGVSTNSADDDFSQPLQQLKLKSSIGHGASNAMQSHHSSPPSPPLTDEQMDVEGGSASAVAPSVKQEQEQGSSLLTPMESLVDMNGHHDTTDADAVKLEPPGTATKRKAPDVGFFSSGSLSPPPTESIELESPSRKAKSEAGGEEPTAPTSAPAPARSATRGPRRSTRSTMKADAPAPTPPTRGRKSMRLS